LCGRRKKVTEEMQISALRWSRKQSRRTAKGRKNCEVRRENSGMKEETFQNIYF
jgi:hypothetical protein